MSELVTDEMVTRGALEARKWGVISKHGEWTDSEAQQQCARDILESAAPAIAAKAWEEGYAEGGRGRMWDSTNPHLTVDAAETSTTRDGDLTGEHVWTAEEIRTTLIGPNQCDPGCTRPSLHDGDCTAAADPLDESDHRPRHDRDGEHLYRWGAGHWHTKDPAARPDWCGCDRLDDRDSLDDWVQAGFGPLTFCDCDTTNKAGNGVTD